MRILYNTGILIYLLIAKLISPFNRKARLWTKGQSDWYKKLKERVNPDAKYIWIHCASLGEFEQGRPVIEALKKERPEYSIMLTFFSPSGYEIRKNYSEADIICYLPADTVRNAKKFIELVNPEKVVFVKYEFWYNYISILGGKNIPLILISGIFRKDQYFFRWYGSFFRRMLDKFSWFYLQDQQSAEILNSEGFENVSVAGDTRFDRVIQIAADAKVIHELERFRGEEKLLLAGSTWRRDEEILAGYINRHPGRMKWVFAPHEIGENNIMRLEKLFSVKCVRFSEFGEGSCDARVLIIDNIGMLSSAYRYASIAVVGGGFGKGIHNILEAACWGIPVLFGPNHNKFREAVEMKANGGGMTFTGIRGFEDHLDRLLDNDPLYKKAAESAFKYVEKNKGATRKILEGIV